MLAQQIRHRPPPRCRPDRPPRRHRKGRHRPDSHRRDSRRSEPGKDRSEDSISCAKIPRPPDPVKPDENSDSKPPPPLRRPRNRPTLHRRRPHLLRVPRLPWPAGLAADLATLAPHHGHDTMNSHRIRTLRPCPVSLALARFSYSIRFEHLSLHHFCQAQRQDTSGRPSLRRFEAKHRRQQNGETSLTHRNSEPSQLIPNTVPTGTRW